MTDVTTAQTELDWWRGLHPTLNWTFAKTMPNVPHSYIVRGRDLGDADFDRAVRLIRAQGVPGRFYSKTRIYLRDGGQRWWTMGHSLSSTTIINVAEGDGREYGEQDIPSTRSGHRTVYDDVAIGYDDRYEGADDLAENAELSRTITQHFGAYAPTTLDVGCGTGLVLDMGVTSPALYTGVDPSQGMLNELVLKHPDAVDLRPGTLAEVSPFFDEPFELVTCLFAGSYLTKQEIFALYDLVAPGGLVLWTTYEDGYLPDYHRGVPPETHDRAVKVSAGLVGEHGGFMSKVGRHDVWRIAG